jgi:hypothetical protein
MFTCLTSGVSTLTTISITATAGGTSRIVSVVVRPSFYPYGSAGMTSGIGSAQL